MHCCSSISIKILPMLLKSGGPTREDGLCMLTGEDERYMPTGEDGYKVKVPVSNFDMDARIMSAEVLSIKTDVDKERSISCQMAIKCAQLAKELVEKTEEAQGSDGC
ncbi:hypothetical protein Tco_1513047 [Tanacetum coccineum]